MKVLVAGWFSFERMGASAGDLLARDIVCQWLQETGRSYEIALAAPFSGGVDWHSVSPADYSHVVFVCGPMGNGPPVDEFLIRFQNCKRIGVNLTMLKSLETWNPFDLLLERDSSAASRPDLTFLSDRPHVPVVGVILIDAQPEYGSRDRREVATEAIHSLVHSREVAAVPIDTRLDENRTGLRTPAEVESLIARMDMVLTTRLHGTVLALKNGVPALAIDPVAGGAKILRQARTIRWPAVHVADALDEERLRRDMNWCLSQEGRAAALDCRDRARQVLARTRDEFVQSLEPYNSKELSGR